MDDRFPNWLRFLLRKLDFLGIPNLAPLICAMMGLAIVAKMTGAPYERFLFVPEAIKEGEWWRIFAFPLPQGLENPIFLVLYVMYTYFILNSIEQHWGAGPTTVFILLSYLAAVAASFVTNIPISIWNYIIENLGLAFGTLFPDFEILFMFIIPLKAKWIAIFSGALLLLQFIGGGLATKIIVALTLSPYFFFFGPLLFSILRNRSKVSKNRKRFDESMWR